MRNAFTFIAALCIGSALSGCNSNSDSPTLDSVPTQISPNPTDQAQGTIAWTVTMQSECPGVSMEYCLAGYKFSVLSDGHYQAGPGPNNEMKTGTLTDEEANAMSAAVASALSGTRLQTALHADFEESNSDSTITLVEGSNDSSSVILVRTEGTDLSYMTSSVESAKGLMTNLQGLAEKYYAIPFPDACMIEADSYSALVTSLQSCTQDSDCSYYDATLQALTSTTNASLRTDDCTLIKPVVVANTSAMAANLAKLQTSQETVSNSCGSRIFRNDCAGIQDILLTGAPVCKQGVCQAQSAN